MGPLHGPKTPVSSGLRQEPHRGTHPFPGLPLTPPPPHAPRPPPPAPRASARSGRLRAPVANCPRCTVPLQPGPLRLERKEQVLAAPPAKQIASHDRAAPLAAALPAPPGRRRVAAWESLQGCRRARGPSPRRTHRGLPLWLQRPLDPTPPGTCGSARTHPAPTFLPAPTLLSVRGLPAACNVLSAANGPGLRPLHVPVQMRSIPYTPHLETQPR
ncbi:atherin-like [Cebus imitator]|uniref:atherin-like n=1 Tax=Cebus imitator TaxID=2715852 RepID=UPI00080A7977|nr:atherin-like [Cebus imitator]